MKDKIEKLIQMYEKENEIILKQNPKLTINGDFSLSGVRFFQNNDKINELKKILIQI